MKRRFFYFAVSTLALTACTSEGVVEDAVVSHNAIRFENVVNKISRANVDLTTDNLVRFNVFGYYTTPKTDENGDDVISNIAVRVFDDVPVTLDKTLGIWSYTGGDRYWVPGAHYYFYAYSCGSIAKLSNDFGEFSMDMDNGINPSDRVLIIKNYICDNTHQHDLVYASNVGATKDNPWHGIVAQESDNPDVSFQFKHILAKVNATITSKFPSDYTVSVSNISLENIRNKGSYNPNDAGVWQNVIRKNDARNFVYLLDTSKDGVLPITTTSAQNPASTEAAFVIPYHYTTSASDTDETGVTLKFHIQVHNKGELIFEKDMVGKFNPNWKAGYKYTYNVEVSGSSTNLQTIVFTTVTDGEGAVTNWGNGTDDPVINIQN